MIVKLFLGCGLLLGAAVALAADPTRGAVALPFELEGPPPHFGYTAVTEGGGPPVLITVQPKIGTRGYSLSADALRQEDGLIKVGKPRVAASHFLALTSQKSVPFLISADGQTIAPRWRTLFEGNTYLLSLPRLSPPERVVKDCPKGPPPEFAFVTVRGGATVLLSLHTTAQWEKQEVEIQRGAKREKATLWQPVVKTLATEVPLNAVTFKTARGAMIDRDPLLKKAKEEPVLVLLVQGGRDLDGFWRPLLLPDAPLGYLESTGAGQ